VISISEKSLALLEIVNFNVEGEQYVCAGTVSLRSLSFLEELPALMALSYEIFTCVEQDA
jgi:hypothetical protein